MRYVDFFNLAETVGCVCMHGGEGWRGTGMPDRGQELQGGGMIEWSAVKCWVDIYTWN